MSTAGRCMAARTSSGTVVGPGIDRNSRPWRTVMGLVFRNGRGMSRSAASDADERAARDALAEFDQFRVFGRAIPGLERRHIRELDDDETLRLPRALQHLVRAAAHDETATMLLDQRQDLPAIFAVDVLIMHLNIGDEIGGHVSAASSTGLGQRIACFDRLSMREIEI